MIDRIGTLGLSQRLLSQYQDIQSHMARTQQQISSGKVGTQYADVKDQSGVLAAAKSKAADVANYTAATKNVVDRLDLYDSQLQGFSDMTARLRQALGDALAMGSGTGFIEKVKALSPCGMSACSPAGDVHQEPHGNHIGAGCRSFSPIQILNGTNIAAEAQFDDAFARFLPHEPNIRTLKRGRERT